MNNKAFHVAGIQLVVAITSAIAAHLLDNPLAAKSVLWGSLASLTNSQMLAWSIGEKVEAGRAPDDHLKAMYLASLKRWVVVASLLMVGLLGLAPLYVVAGFAAGQMGMIAARLLMNGLEIK